MSIRISSHFTGTRVAGLATLAALALLAGCEATPSAPPVRGRSLNAQRSLPARDAEKMAQQAASDLQRILTARDDAKAAAANSTLEPPPADEAASVGTAAETAASPSPDPASSLLPLEETKTVEANASRRDPSAGRAANHDEDFADLASRLARALRDTSCENSAARNSRPEAMTLAALEALRPGALSELDSPASPLGKLLTPEDLATLRDARDRLMGDRDARLRLAEAAGRTLDSIAPPAAITIMKSALCSRVNGFGSYTAFPTSAFLIGRPLRAIVYLELDGFGKRAARESDPGFISVGEPQHAVEITQTLGLYQDQSGLLAWRSPARTSIEVTQSARRDFYLVQMIDLPRNLSIGRYRLKVTVTDKTTNASTETSFPIDIVADQTLTVRHEANQDVK